MLGLVLRFMTKIARSENRSYREIKDREKERLRERGRERKGEREIAMERGGLGILRREIEVREAGKGESGLG